MVAENETAVVVGPPQILKNQAQSSIHDPVEAQKLGFRGPAVGANVHLDLFVPPLTEVYGNCWLEKGALSLYFLNVVVSGEQARGVVERPSHDGAQVNIREERADDPSIVVSSGTASLGDHSRSALRTRDLKTCDDGQLRMLKGLKVGQPFASRQLIIPRARQERQLEVGELADQMGWYSGRSPWGDPIASMNNTSLMMTFLINDDDTVVPKDTVSPHIGDALSIFGAFEIAFENGPVFLDRPYTIEGNVVGVGDSPKTELLWWDAVALDGKGVPVVRMRHLFRFMKASSPLYPELSAE